MPDKGRGTDPTSVSDHGEGKSSAVDSGGDTAPSRAETVGAEAGDRITSAADLHAALTENRPVELHDTAKHPEEDLHQLAYDDFLGPSSVAQFFTLEKCPQYFKYTFDEEVKKAESRRKDYREAFEPLSGLLAKEGNEFEDRIVSEITDSDSATVDLEDDDTSSTEELDDTLPADLADTDTPTDDLPDVVATDNDTIVDALCATMTDPDPEYPNVLMQTSLTGYIGAWPIHGAADLIYIWYNPDDREFRLRVVDVKAAHDEKPYQQIQVAMYAIMLRRFLNAVWPEDTDLTYTIEGGVSHRETEEVVGTPDDLPSFTLWPRENDIRSLLAPGELFDQLDDTPNEEIRFRLNQKCHRCTFREACYTNAVEDKSTALLGLSRSQQERLEDDYGVEDVGDLAKLAYIPDEDNDAKPYLYDTLHYKSRYSDTVDDLRQDAGIGSSLAELVQRAQTLVTMIDPSTRGYKPNDIPWLIGSGNGELPEDDPPPGIPMPGEHGDEDEGEGDDESSDDSDDTEEITLEEALETQVEAEDEQIDDVERLSTPEQEYELNRPQRGHLTRIYLFVEEDYRNDVVAMLGGYVTATAYEQQGGEPLNFAELIEHIPEHGDDDDVEDYEYDLLKAAYERIEEKVGDIREALDRDNDFVHVYVYGSGERSALLDALERHSDDEDLAALRDFLLMSGDVNDGRDQQTMSIIQRDIRQRVALPFPNVGLLPADRMIKTRNFAPRDWKYERDGETFDATEVFKYRMFDFAVPYIEDGDTVEPHTDENTTQFLPLRVRSDAQIPLEYIWWVTDRIDADWVEEVEREGSGQPVSGFRYHDLQTREREINREDVEALGERLAKLVMAVERELEVRDPFMDKRPVQFEDPPSLESGHDARLAQSLTEFLDIEHESQRRELHDHYALPPLQRIRTGQSIPIALCAEPETGSSGTFWEFEAMLAYEAFFDEDTAERMKNRCRLKDGDEGSGSWMVMTQLDADEAKRGRAKQVHYRDGKNGNELLPRDIERNVPVTIEELNLDEGPENRGRVRFQHMNFFTGDDRDQPYDHTLRTVTDTPADEGFFKQLVQYGQYYILDPQTDDVNAQKSREMIADRAAFDNPMYQRLDALLNGETVTTDRFRDEDIDMALEWMDDYFEHRDNDGHPPNSDQREFVKETDSQFSLLQGPPGTGKTGGALSKTLLTRAVSLDEQGRSGIGLVTGKSHTSVDEMLADTAEIVQQYQNDPETDDRNIRLLRLGGVEPEPDDPDYEPWMDTVEYFEHFRDEDAHIRNELFGHLLTAADDDVSGETTQFILFTTPGKFHGLMNKYGKYLDGENNPRPEEILTDYPGQRHFDYLAVDEASMMNLPEFILAGSFIREDAQVFICGDQRQMPPIIQHDWNGESRWTATELAPHLSVLDYMRFLRGEDIETIDEDDVVDSPNVDIAMNRLKWTYRCHPAVAKFLRKYHYQKDNIAYESMVDDIIDTPVITDQDTGIGTALRPEKPLVLIKHSETSQQQLNPTEGALTEALMQGLNPAQRGDTGIVVPHNAQKAWIRSSTPDDVEVDTVERFQGGERSVITVSATASDPDFVKQEQEFLLNPNRLNVAMSRMQEKLFLIGSESVFDVVPDDVDTYEQAVLWKALYQEADVLDSEPDWDGTVREFLADAPNPGDINSDYAALDENVEVYVLGEEDIELPDE